MIKMRVLVLGIGKMGTALVKDLVKSPDVTEVVAGRRDIQKLKQFVEELGSDKVKPVQIDATNHEELVKLIKSDGGFDVVANTLLARVLEWNVGVIKAVIESGVNYVDVGSRPTPELDKSAKDAGVTIVPSCGLEPGLDRFFVGYAARKLDKVEKIRIRCGGIPQRNIPPLGYIVTWSHFEYILPMYTGKVKILQDGKIVEVDKLTDIETIRFPEPVGECEAFYASYPGDLIEALNLKDVKEASPIMTVPLLVFVLLAVIIGIYPKLVTDYLLPLIGSLLPL